MKNIPEFELPGGPFPDLPEVPEDPQWITQAWRRLPLEERAKLRPLPQGEPFTLPDDWPPNSPRVSAG